MGQQAQSAGCPPLCMSYSVALNNWLKRKKILHGGVVLVLCGYATWVYIDV